MAWLQPTMKKYFKMLQMSEVLLLLFLIYLFYAAEL